MKKVRFSIGILLVILVCIVVRLALAGGKSYAKKQEIQQFHTLVEDFIKSDINKEANVFLDESAWPQDERNWEEYERFHIDFLKLADELPAKEWVSVLENDQIKAKYFFINLLEDTDFQVKREIERSEHLFEESFLSGDEKMLLYNVLQPQRELRKKLEDKKLQWIPESADAVESCSYILNMCGYPNKQVLFGMRGINNWMTEISGCTYEKKVVKAADQILEHPEQFKPAQQAGAVMAKLSLEDTVEEYPEEEKAQMSELLRQEYERLAMDEKGFYGSGARILENILSLKRTEDIDWLLEQAQNSEKELSQEGWGQAQRLDEIFWNCVWGSDVQKILKESTDPEEIQRMICMLNQLLSMDYQKRCSDFSSVKRMAAELQKRLDSGEITGELPLLSQVPLNASTQSGEEKLWKAVCDVDQDGLADEEMFHARDEQGNATYHISFGNGDVLDYSYPVRFDSIYRRKWTDVNGDGRKELVVWFHTDQTAIEIIDGNEVPEDRVETYGTLLGKEPNGIVVFEKKEGAKQYTPVLTKDGETMVTGVVEVYMDGINWIEIETTQTDESAEGTQRDWIKELVWE